MHPRILIATTTWWAMPARLALAFAQSGAHVSAVFPPGNPLEKVRCLSGRTRYRALAPASSLQQAIAETQPDLIIPCDDRVVAHIHQLYALSSASPRNEQICSLIERSLGDPANYPIACDRHKVLVAAERAGIRVPQTGSVRDLEALKSWLQEHGFPAVLKVDGTWGGSGVRVVQSWDEAARAFHELNHPMTVGSVIGHLSFHDFYAVFPWKKNGNRELTVQSYVEGAAGNAMFTCWQGRVVESLCVDVLYSQEKLGASTVIRTSSNAEIERAGQIIVQQLGLSGFCGLDFIVEGKTGHPYLIELNPRATQLGHLQPPGGRSLARALYDELMGVAGPRTSGELGETIAFFPQALQRGVSQPVLTQSNARFDIPWDEPDLTRELMRRPWNTRHLSAWVYIAAQKLLNLLSPVHHRRPKKKLVPSDPGA